MKQQLEEMKQKLQSMQQNTESNKQHIKQLETLVKTLQHTIDNMQKNTPVDVQSAPLAGLPATATATPPAPATLPSVPVPPSAPVGGKRRKGGYRATKKDKAALKKLRQGKSIGFTMRSSLKAKGLLRRANGTMRVSQKYRKN
jgi:TolA-binding protein